MKQTASSKERVWQISKSSRRFLLLLSSELEVSSFEAGNDKSDWNFWRARRPNGKRPLPHDVCHTGTVWREYVQHSTGTVPGVPGTWFIGGLRR